jgi:succinate dehydrogenase / fumarate reductase flavoprotein subunit
MVGELLLDKARKRVRGAILVSQVGGTTQAIAAKAVVLATGGAGQAFEVNVYPDDCTGDGYALAYRAGAELVNLEFIQIGLCSLKTKLACSGSMMRALPRLVNDREQEFLMSYMPPGTDYTRMYEILFAKGASWPVSQRDASHILDIAVAAELAAGRRVFLDYARDPEGLDLASFGQNIARWYNEGKGVDGVDLADKARVGTPLARLRAINQPSVDWLAERGVDLAAGDKVEIAPAVQHFQGGVKIRTQGDTTLAGLYAAGEVAGGQHGANRPGGNALLDTQVFGRVAGEGAARYVRSHPCEIDETDAIKPGLAALFARSGVAAGKVRTQVRQAMALYCGVYRTQAGLSTLNALLDALARRGIRRGDSLTSDLEALNILQTARLVARAALERDESRGPHLRFAEDGSLTPLPLDEGWQRYGVLWRGEQGPEWEAREPVRPASAP